MSTSFYTPVEDIPRIHQRVRNVYRSGKLKSIEYRREQIAQVGYLLKDNEQRFIDAMLTDLGRPAQETIFFDFAAVYIDVKTAYDNVAKWTKPERATFNLNFFVMNPRLRPEPKGVVLAIAPFNAPVFMLLGPLIGAIAGGNAVVLKPSEQSPGVAKLFAELVPKYLDQDLFHVINGGIPETTRVLELPWDHIIYTGNGRVARIISAAAAKHLTPTTLELGGKNPVVIDPKCDVELAARRILWGRTCNAGQVCLAPEYVLLPESFQDTFVQALKDVYRSFYPHGPKDSDSFCRIVTEAHTARIKDLIDRTKGTVVFGGDADVAERYVAPTVVKDVRPDDPLMEGEIFGPVLLLVPVKDVDEALEIINSKDHPLAIYAFSSDQAFLDKVFDNTESGAAVANEVVISIGVPGLPMGGVGASGHGYFTGKHMFDEFTHLRVSLNNPGWVDKIAFGFRFPPYKPEKEKQLRALSPSLPPRPSEKKHTSMIGSCI
ncbi:NAD-aldehyde dehydrogenase [Cubamyces sp. BRFM 1775]|nr:NAD-aldehyde dehydrogenase [Cubamyces sp. BRFM 1775]